MNNYKKFLFFLMDTIGIALIALLPLLLWHWMNPILHETPLILKLNEPPASHRLSELTGTRLDAHLTEQKFNKLFTTIETLKYEFVIPETISNAYTLFSITSNDESKKVEIRINKHLVDTMALYRDTGSLYNNFEKHYIQRTIQIPAGRNSISLTGEHLSHRTIILLLYPQKNISAKRFLMILITSLFIYGLLLKISKLIALKPQYRPWIIALTVILLSFGYLMLLIRQHDYRDLGNTINGFQHSIKTLEDYLDSNTHRDKADEIFSVCILGDSSHFYRLPPDHHLRQAVAQSFPKSYHDRVEIYGSANKSNSPVNYFYLANLVTKKHPDLLIIPINVRSFSNGWAYIQERYYRKYMHRLTQWPEYPAARSLEMGEKGITFLSFVSQKLDAQLTDFQLHPMLDGLRAEMTSNATMRKTQIEEYIIATTTIRPPKWDFTNTHSFTPELQQDHLMFRALDHINRLAEKHNTPILYYYTPVNQEGQLARGVDLNMEINYNLIKNRVHHPPQRYFINLAEGATPNMFSDDFEHLTPLGIDYVAENLKDFILLQMDSKTR